MILKSTSTWLMLGFLLLQCMSPADVQMAMGMYPPYGQSYGYMPPQMAYAPAMMAMPAAVAIIEQRRPSAHLTSTTTTTTTETPIHIAVGVPVPVPYPFAVPAVAPPQACQQRPRPPQCPPCPPCLCMPCVPAFFSYCSPCHQKCRCQDGQRPPEPLPIQQPPVAMPMPIAMPMPGPSPVVVLPFSRYNRQDKGYYRQDSSDSSSWERSSDSSDSSCEDSSYRRSRRRPYYGGRVRFRPRNSRRSFNARRKGSNKLVKPMLSYVAPNGDVQFETKISNVEAMELLRSKAASHEKATKKSELDDSKSSNRRYVQLQQHSPHKVEVMATEDTSGRHKVVVLANQPRKIALNEGVSERQLKEGRKELIFNAPKNRKISNMSISFQIER